MKYLPETFYLQSKWIKRAILIASGILVLLLLAGFLHPFSTKLFWRCRSIVYGESRAAVQKKLGNILESSKYDVHMTKQEIVILQQGLSETYACQVKFDDQNSVTEVTKRFEPA